MLSEHDSAKVIHRGDQTRLVLTSSTPSRDFMSITIDAKNKLAMKTVTIFVTRTKKNGFPSGGTTNSTLIGGSVPNTSVTPTETDVKEQMSIAKNEQLMQAGLQAASSRAGKMSMAESETEDIRDIRDREETLARLEDEREELVKTFKRWSEYSKRAQERRFVKADLDKIAAKYVEHLGFKPSSYI